MPILPYDTYTDSGYNNQRFNANGTTVRGGIGGYTKSIVINPYMMEGGFLSPSEQERLSKLIGQSSPIGITIKEEVMKKYLFNVTVVDLDGNILRDKKVVAETEEEAKFKSGAYSQLTDLKIEISNVTIICTSLGQVKTKPVKD